jgi:hypothetical protein
MPNTTEQATPAPGQPRDLALEAGRYPKTSGAPEAPQGKPGALPCVFDMGTVDTTPGARCAMAPSHGSALDPHQYQNLMRERYRADMAARQHMAIYARRLYSRPNHAATNIVGPYATQARTILEAINARHATC